MKVTETYTLEVGDIFEGKGEGGYLQPCEGWNCGKILVSSNNYVRITGYGSVSKTVEISGSGISSVFSIEDIVDHIKRGNIIYIGNVNGRS